MAVFAFDFDGTLCEIDYPNIGKPKTKMIELAKQLKRDGHQLILWTCRSGIELEKALFWCRQQGVKFDAVNENLKRDIELWGTDPRKICADYYIDDKAIDPDSLLKIL